MADERPKDRVVLVTGFGPFTGHPINASWEAVKELRNIEFEKNLNVVLITEEIPVTYHSVSTLIPKLWSKHDPMLVIHVGVSSVARCLTLESRAHRSGYYRADVENKKCPLDTDTSYENEIDPSCCDNVNTDVEEEVLETGVDVERICDSINNISCDTSVESCKAQVSTNAGRYLCEYIFRQSLMIKPKRTIFVHVPDMPVYPTKKTTEGLYHVIRFAIQMMDNYEN